MRSRDDAGFTIVEVVISLTILTVGIVGVVGVFHSSFGASIHTTERSRATALATEYVESLRATPYEAVVPDNTVHTENVTRGGTRFRVDRTVTWAPKGLDPEAYKRATVVVTWTQGGTTHEARQTSFLYPTGVTTTTAAGTGSTPPAAPTALLATLPSGAQGATSVDLAWTPPSSSTPRVARWLIERSTDNFVTSVVVTDDEPVVSTSYRVTGLSAGATYRFRVAGVSADGAVSGWSPVATVTTLASALTTCRVESAQVSPASIPRTSRRPSALVQQPVVVVDTQGPGCAGINVRFSPQPGDERTQALVPSTGGEWKAVLGNVPAGMWTVGDHVIDVYDSLGTKRASTVLRVCEAGRSQC